MPPNKAIQVDRPNRPPYADDGGSVGQRVGLLILAISLGCASQLYSQTAGILTSRNAPTIGAVGSLGLPESAGAAIRTGYTIAGVLDFGLTVGVDADLNGETVRTDVGLFYSVAPVRQSDTVPFSSQVYGAYSFRGEQSEFLEENRLLRAAVGYSLGVVVVRDFALTGSLGLRLGMLGEFQNYRETTSAGFDTEGFAGSADVNYDEFPEVRLLTKVEFGGYGGLTFVAPAGTIVVVGTAVLMDFDATLRLRPELRILLGG